MKYIRCSPSLTGIARNVVLLLLLHILIPTMAFAEYQGLTKTRLFPNNA